MNFSYKGKSDENLIPVVAPLLSAVGSDTTSSDNALSPGSDSVEGTPLGDAVKKDNEVAEKFEESIFLSGDKLLSGYALFPDLRSLKEAPLTTHSGKTMYPMLQLESRSQLCWSVLLYRRVTTHRPWSWGPSIPLRFPKSFDA